MSFLRNVPIRVMREGKPISVCADELAFITAIDVAELPGVVAGPLIDALNTSNDWYYDHDRHTWERPVAA